MNLILKSFSYNIYITSILYSLAFFVKTLLFRHLYKLTNSFDNSNESELHNFYNNVLSTIFLIIFVEVTYRLLYYKSKEIINSVITGLFKKSINNLISSKYYYINKYDKDQLYALNDLIYIFDSVCEKILLNLPRNMIYLVYYLYELNNFSFKSVIMINCVSIISTFCLHYFTKIKERNYDELYRTDTKIKKLHTERLRSLRFVKTSVTENYEKNKNNKIYSTRENLKNRDMQLSNILMIIPELTGTVMTGVIYLFGSQLLKPLDLIFLGSNSNNFILFIIDTKSIYDDFCKHWNHMKLIFEIINDNKHLEPSNPMIQRDLIINQLQITNKKNNKLPYLIETGDICTITGKNGCGKTTMIYSMLELCDFNNWIFKFECNNSGVFSTIPYQDLRWHTTMVFQDPYLFDDTIWYNVTYGISDLNIEKVYNVAKSMGLDNWLFENKDRETGLNGEFLSGGEKKKIQLLNAFLHDKQIYIFDEPTNNLDKDIENWYIKQIMDLAEINNKIVIIITHNNKIIEKSDVNIHLD